MEKKIIKYFESIYSLYIPIPEESIEKIYDLYFNKKFTDPLTDIECFYYGFYYHTQENEVNMMKYYLMAIEKGNSYAMNNLGWYYYKKRDNTKMMEYFLMAIDKGNSEAMRNLAYYYKKIGDETNRVKYLLMAIDQGNKDAMVNLGAYYEKKGDETNMLKYYSMCINEYADYIIDSLEDYYKKKGDDANMLKFYLMAMDKGNTDVIKYLKKYCRHYKKYDILAKYYYEKQSYKKLEKVINIMIQESQPLTEPIIECILECGDKFSNNVHPVIKLLYNTLKLKIDLMELHFNYSDKGKGFEEAKTDFIKQLTQ